LTAIDTKSWEGVKLELLRRIQNRVWAPGTIIPPEKQLAEEFQCSRTTVNRAMRELATVGLIERKRKAGTRVLATPARKAVFSIPITRLEIQGRGHAYRFVQLEFTAQPAKGLVASRLGVPPKSEVMRARTLHFADSAPFLYEDRWINPAAVPKNIQSRIGDLSLNEWLVRNVPYSEGDIAFSAANSTNLEAEHLGIPPGTAVLVVDRTTRNDTGVITVVRLVYAPGYRLHTDI
jgi:GntR family transcriptional regulator, histidine utilization repressor